MFLSKRVSDSCFSVNDDGEKILFKAENYSEPLRGYSVEGGKTVYAGLSEPCEGGFELTYRYNKKPDRFIAVKGVIEENHDIICEFEFSKPSAYSKKQDFVKYIFSHPAACDCVKYYGHFYVFRNGKDSVFAFPSDNDMHPLLHLIPFSFWYPVNLGSEHTGYYFIGVSENNKPFFASKNILTQILGQ